MARGLNYALAARVGAMTQDRVASRTSSYLTTMRTRGLVETSLEKASMKIFRYSREEYVWSALEEIENQANRLVTWEMLLIALPRASCEIIDETTAIFSIESTKELRDNKPLVRKRLKDILAKAGPGVSPLMPAFEMYYTVVIEETFTQKYRHTRLADIQDEHLRSTVHRIIKRDIQVEGCGSASRQRCMQAFWSSEYHPLKQQKGCIAHVISWILSPFSHPQ